MAFTAITALATAGTAASATMVFAAVAQLGTIMSIVGAVTGSKDLMKFGGFMSLAGGLGGFAAGGLTAGGAAASAGELASASAADVAGGMVPEFATDVAYQSGLQGADALATGIEAGSAVGSALPDIGQVAANMPVEAPQGIVSQPAVSADVMQPTAMPTPDVAMTPTTPTAPAPADMSIGAPPSPYGEVGNYNAPTKVASGDYFSRIGGWLNDNKGLVQIGGNVLSGMQKSDQFDQQMDLQNRRLAQTGYGSATARSYGGIISRKG